MQKSMLVLRRVADKVFFEDQELTIVAQATKGPGKEVVKIDGLPGSNGQKWVSLSKLVEGSNTLNCVGKEVTSANYVLTASEAARIKVLQAEIDEIKAAAKARFVAKPKLVNPAQLTREQAIAELEKFKKYYNL